jgi:hypothetical protein
MNNEDKKVGMKQHDFLQFISKGNLNLSRQELTDSDIPELIHFLLNNPDVKTLDLSLNNIGDQGIADFAERNQTTLQVNFAGNNISDLGVAVFAYKNRTVTQVNFTHNLISEEGIASFAEINQTCITSRFSKINLH